MSRTGGALFASSECGVRLRGPATPHITSWSSFALPLKEGGRHTTIVVTWSDNVAREARGGGSWGHRPVLLDLAAIRQRRPRPRSWHRPNPVRTHRVARSRRVLRRAPDCDHPDERRLPLDWNPGRFDPFRRRAVHALGAAGGVAPSGRSDHQAPGGPRRESVDRNQQRTGPVARPEPRDPCADGALQRPPRRPSRDDLGGTHAGVGASAPLPFRARGFSVFRVSGRAQAPFRRNSV